LKNSEVACLPISVYEVRKINEELPLNLNEKSSKKIPWAGFFASGAVWAIIIAYFTQAWGFYVLLTWLPTYMKQKHGLKIEDAGFYSLLPFLGLSFSVPIFGKLADFLYNKKVMGKLAVRKTFQALGEFGPAFFLFLIGLLEPPTALSVIFMTIAVTMAGWQMGGVNVNHIDLSPKYAGLLLGISNTAGTLPGIFGVGLTGFILEATDQSWPTVFYLAAGIYTVGAVLYLVLAKSKVIFV
jgi:nitrate/nitrite transporter NarK